MARGPCPENAAGALQQVSPPTSVRCLQSSKVLLHTQIKLPLVSVMKDGL